MNTIKILDVVSCWKVLCVVYRDAAADSAENEVKILPYSEEAAKCLSAHLGCAADVSDLNAHGVPWVDESEFYENGVEIRIEFEEEVIRSIEQFCCKYNTTSEKLFYGISCFLCNPANGELVLGWLKDALDTEMNGEQQNK